MSIIQQTIQLAQHVSSQIDIPAVVRALYKINYQGICSVEFEKDADNPIAGIAESTGYFRGVCDVIRKMG